MRIGLLIYGSIDTISGGYLYDRKLVEYLRGQGDSVEIVSLLWRNYARHLGDNLSTLLFHRLEHLPVDVLLEDELNHPSLFWLNRRLSSRVTYPILAIVHHLRCSEERPTWKNWLYTWVERSYLQSAAGFVYNSQTTQAAVEALVGSRQANVIAYPAGDRFQPQLLDDEIFKRAHQPGPLRLVFVGNLIRRKGLHTLIDALGRLPTGMAMLSVIGRVDVDPDYTRAICRQAGQLGGAGLINFLGPLNDAELAAELRTSQVLVVPSSYEGFGIVYLEGMSFGLPAIASTAGAAGEIITPGENGALIAPGDAGTLANTIRVWHSDRQQLAALSLAARRRFKAAPGWEQSGAAVRCFLQSMPVKSARDLMGRI